MVGERGWGEGKILIAIGEPARVETYRELRYAVCSPAPTRATWLLKLDTLKSKGPISTAKWSLTFVYPNGSQGSSHNWDSFFRKWRPRALTIVLGEALYSLVTPLLLWHMFVIGWDLAPIWLYACQGSRKSGLTVLFERKTTLRAGSPIGIPVLPQLSPAGS